VIRVTAITCLLSLLGLVLYLPAAYPAEQFLLQLRAEHSTLARALGESAAWHVLSRSLSWHESSRNAPSLPSSSGTPAGQSSNSNAVADEMTSVNRRLFGNAYFRSVEALVVLAAFRLSSILQWLPWLAAFAVAALFDGRTDGLVNAKEFRRHNPELFSMFLTCALLTIAVMAIAIVLPHSLHPSLLPLGLVGVIAMAARVVAHYRRDG
jgi:uncharacterized membrane protein